MRQLFYATPRRFFSSHYQFLHRSNLPMLHFQASLPRLPIPTLSATCQRYLEALRPLLTAEVHARTTRLVGAFEKGEGVALQEALKAQDAANKHTSYISEPWSDMYLRDRAPLPVNYTPLLGMRHTSHPPRPLATEVANILVTTARFMRALRQQLLPPEVFFLSPKTADSALYNAAVRVTPARYATYAAYAFKAFPLDMSQYQGLFSATRIPAHGKDAILRAERDPRHVMVMRGGNIYRLDILDRDGNIVEPSVVLGRVKRLLEVEKQASHPLGVLTAQNRDTWADVRAHIERLSERNKRNFSLIDSAIFCLCLDDIHYSPDAIRERVADCLYGNSGNRWFDKSLSVIVSKDSRSSVTFEHSWGDGVAVLRYFNELYRELSESPRVSGHEGVSSVGEDFIELLDFDMDDKVRLSVVEAKKSHESVEKSLDINYMMAPIDKKLCKMAKVSPDSVAQLTIQLAYALVTNGGTTATYESCSTAAFRCGRTETVRPATSATRAFSNAVLTGKSENDLIPMLRECSQRHNQLTKEAAMGQGFDRHLFALRKLSETKMADIFQDGAYKLINHNVLSTSTLSSAALEVGGFGPVVSNGYGIGYSIDAEKLGMVVTTYRAERNGREFVEALQRAAGEIKKVLQMAAKQ